VSERIDHILQDKTCFLTGAGGSPLKIQKYEKGTGRGLGRETD